MKLKKITQEITNYWPFLSLIRNLNYLRVSYFSFKRKPKIIKIFKSSFKETNNFKNNQ